MCKVLEMHELKVGKQNKQASEHSEKAKPEKNY